MVRAAYEHLAPLLERVAEVPGDFAEIGVWRGDTFVPLAERAGGEGRLSHAVDTFAGCLEPGPKDFNPDGSCEYPRGSLAADRNAFRARVAGLPNVRIHEGAVPEIFKSFRATQKFAFVHVDLDHAAPTLEALSWAWNRVRPGGIVCSHDWFPDSDRLASAGIKAFMERHAVRPSGERADSRHVWFEAARVDPWGSHLPLLALCVAATTGPLLELGSGEYSTPVLDALASAGRRRLVTVESSREWRTRLAPYARGGHEFVGPEAFEALAQESWDVAFVDSAPAGVRVGQIEALRKTARLLVIHNTEPGRPGYRYDEILPTFRFRVDYRRCPTWTTVVSDVDDLAWLRSEMPCFPG